MDGTPALCDGRPVMPIVAVGLLAVPAVAGAVLDWPVLLTLALMVPGLVVGTRAQAPGFRRASGRLALLGRMVLLGAIIVGGQALPDGSHRYWGLIIAAAAA